MDKWINPVILPGILASTAIAQPQIATSLSPVEIGKIAKDITVSILGPGNPGSGVLIAREGNCYFVLTAAHVVKNINPGEEVDVVTSDGAEHFINTRTIQWLPGIDLAIVEFRSERSYPLAQIGDSDTAIELTEVFVAGFPIAGQAIQRNFFITDGRISSRDYLADGYGLIYNNVTREGMSGGPILNKDGHLIGIHGRAEGTRIGGEIVKAGLNLGIPMRTFLEQARRARINLDWPIATASAPTSTPAQPPVEQLPIEQPPIEPEVLNCFTKLNILDYRIPFSRQRLKKDNLSKPMDITYFSTHTCLQKAQFI